MILIALVCIFVGCIYYAFIKPHRFWKERGVKSERPSFIVGNLGPILFQTRSMAELLQDFYNKHPQDRFVALYLFLRPTLILRDPELIKQIAIKDFDSLPEHTSFAFKENDPIWSNTLFAMPGNKQWRDIRSVLSPAYTTNKLKIMHNLIVECAKQFTDYFDQSELTALEFKETFGKVTNDIIATTAFGVSCNTMANPDNEIYTTAQQVTKFDGLLMNITFFTAAISPTLAKMFKIRLISEKNTQFFKRIIKETIDVREDKGIIRPDMIHLMMEARKGRLRNEEINFVESEKENAILTDDVMTAQAVVFFLAGFDTVSTALSYTAHELAVNANVQAKLQREIDETLKEGTGDVTYEMLLKMEYLDMVVSESLRKWPPFAVTDRKAIKPFTVETNEGKIIHLDDNVVCQIPIFSLHRDSNYFPDPELFDPERFNQENKLNIKPFTYLPFGIGPRNCIGSRFALLSLKTVIFYLLSKFDIVAIEKTRIPLELSKTNVNPVPADGYWLGLKPRKLKM